MSVLVAVFLFGFEALLAQMVLLREFLGIVGGNELFLSLFYGAWFLGIFAGSGAGVVARPRRERLERVASLLLGFQAIWLSAALVLVRCWRLLAGIPEGTLLPVGGMVTGLAVTAFPFAVLTGFLFPILCRLWEERRQCRRSGGVEPSGQQGSPGSSATVGSVYGLEALGSLVAGLTVAFFLVERVRPLAAATGSAACITAAAAFLLRGARRETSDPTRPRRRSTPLSAGLFLLAVALSAFLFHPVFARLDAWSRAQRWRSLAGSITHVAQVQSRYQQIDLGQLEDQYSLLLDGQFAESFPDPYAAAAEAHLVMAQAPGAHRILKLGGGLNDSVQELLRHPDVRIDYVELDAAVWRIVEGRLSPETAAAFRDPRVTVHWVDGRRFVKERLPLIRRGEQEPFDLVVSTVPDPTNASLNRFFTREFFGEVHSILRPGGVFVLRIGSAVNYFGPEIRRFTGSVYSSVSSQFREVLATPGETAWLFASDARDRLTSDPLTLAERFRTSGVESPFFRPEHFQLAFEPEHTRKTNAAFRAELGRVPLNRDVHPITYLFGLRLWGFYSGSALQKVFGFLEAVPAGWIFLAACVAIGIGAAPLIVRRRSCRVLGASSLFVITLTGLTGMALSLVLLFAFQNLFGYLYREIGLLVGLFMAGLALGGFVFRNPHGTGRNRKEGCDLPAIGGPPAGALTGSLARLLFWQTALAGFLAGAAGILTFLTRTGSGAALSEPVARAALDFLMVVGGFMTGATFPLVGHVQAALGADLGKRSARLESADHLGAAVGALLTGMLLVPRLGLTGTLLLLALLQLGGALVLALPLVGRTSGTRAAGGGRISNLPPP